MEGQTDILTMGLPYISPYNVNSILNPILVACLGLGYFFNLYRGKPLVREGGVVIMTHPTPVGVQPGPPPELHRLLRAGTERDHRSGRGGEPVRGVVRHRPLVRPSLPHRPRLPRRPSRSTCGTGAPTPSSTWAGSSSWVGTRRPFTASVSGPRPTLTDALEMATDVVGPSPSLTHLHTPPVLMADVQ